MVMAVGDKTDAELLAEWQDLGLDIAGPQRILDLHRAERERGVGPPDCRRAGIAYAEMAYLAVGTSSPIAPTVSSIGTVGSTRWI